MDDLSRKLCGNREKIKKCGLSENSQKKKAAEATGKTDFFKKRSDPRQFLYTAEGHLSSCLGSIILPYPPFFFLPFILQSRLKHFFSFELSKGEYLFPCFLSEGRLPDSFPPSASTDKLPRISCRHPYRVASIFTCFLRYESACFYFQGFF